MMAEPEPTTAVAVSDPLTSDHALKAPSKRRYSSFANDIESGIAVVVTGPSRKKKRAPSPSGWKCNGKGKAALSILTHHQHDHDHDGESEGEGELHIYHLSKQLRDACDEISSLRYLIQQTEDECRERELVVRQELVFQNVVQREDAMKSMRQERSRWGRLVASYRAEHQREVSRLNEANDKLLEEERKRFEDKCKALQDDAQRATRDYTGVLANFHLIQQHLEATNGMLRITESDLAELQRLEIEERTERLDGRKGLPPSYISLVDSKDYLPPYSAHAHRDVGKLDLDTVTSTVRSQFSQSLRDATVHALKIREARNSSAAGMALFIASSEALVDSCIALGRIVEKALDIAIAGSSKGEKLGSGQHIVHVTDAAAKLIIDMSWNIVSAMELRSYSANGMKDKLRARNSTHFRQIDDVLSNILKIRLESTVIEELLPQVGSVALRCNSCKSSFCGGYCERLHAVSYYFTTVKQVRKKLEHIISRDGQVILFGETIGCLAETLEAERAQAANVAPTRQLSPTPVIDAAEMEAAVRNSQQQTEQDLDPFGAAGHDDEDLPPTARQSFQSEVATPYVIARPTDSDPEELSIILRQRVATSSAPQRPIVTTSERPATAHAPRRSPRSANRPQPSYAETETETEGESRLGNTRNTPSRRTSITTRSQVRRTRTRRTSRP